MTRRLVVVWALVARGWLPRSAGSAFGGRRARRASGAVGAPPSGRGARAGAGAAGLRFRWAPRLGGGGLVRRRARRARGWVGPRFADRGRASWRRARSFGRAPGPNPPKPGR